MDQAWFEMRDVRRRWLKDAVWVPLRSSEQIIKEGRFGFMDYRSEFYGVGTLAVPLGSRSDASKLDWMGVGISHNHSGIVDGDKYIPADEYHEWSGKFVGLHLVLDQRGSRLEHEEWHLHQDFVVTLGLKREGDIWVRPEDDYIQVAKLTRRADGSPASLVVRASYLRDYLCARGMALYVTSYRDRDEIVEDASEIKWQDGKAEEIEGTDRWVGYVTAIHEGGEPFGEEIAVFHAGRTDIDPQDDIPILGPPTDGNIASASWRVKHKGRKLFRVDGQFWRTEWIEPASSSPIVRGDQVASRVFFVTDAEGKKENADTLRKDGRWLWFRPEVISVLLGRRGGSLKWYTRETAAVGASPGHEVHFGVNSLGLVTVYAKDIALLPEWQQQIWAGYNVPPEGKVSSELLASQAHAIPADTQPPEPFVSRALSALADVSKRKLNIDILREHTDVAELINRIHRFRATDDKGLYALAKDVAKLTADRLDEKQLQTIVSPPKGSTWGSLKSLEKVLASKIGDAPARTLMGPLFGIYELRLADAHLSSAEIEDSKRLVGLDTQLPQVMQGRDLVHALVITIREIVKTIENNW